ncbi:hypothetical protein LX15_001146 [Streptoalloteichus tenebrarius]|uniref:Uncharacterized protein n=1 Tax=Streptoalloteichus tenebrarius (strain ATCC 17920 / DSM 40477 / JCM 4838 / CBS 697.72 / NBRC 16177 / NCIMB 11028 / NRRL B-12390 / A12253. 1 / ISP 5477) TaxID=1933 RepID=A0ABT1HPM2_STRSD|nr:hypothetical protein [Streptoalloteichus tenebrarius]BFE98410.1 hypothetical protein GCM10020241_00860 [Streptoalloteichus tenebrarius]
MARVRAAWVAVPGEVGWDWGRGGAGLRAGSAVGRWRGGGGGCPKKGGRRPRQGGSGTAFGLACCRLGWVRKVVGGKPAER